MPPSGGVLSEEVLTDSLSADSQQGACKQPALCTESRTTSSHNQRQASRSVEKIRKSTHVTLAEPPYVALVGVGLVLEEFGAHVERGPDLGHREVHRAVQDLRDPEVAKLQREPWRRILRLDNSSVGVEILEVHHAPDSSLTKRRSSSSNSSLPPAVCKACSVS